MIIALFSNFYRTKVESHEQLKALTVIDKIWLFFLFQRCIESLQVEGQVGQDSIFKKYRSDSKHKFLMETIKKNTVRQLIVQIIKIDI